MTWRHVEKLEALNSASDSFDFSMNKQPKCPHCGEVYDISENEAWRMYDDNNSHDAECPACGHGFIVNSHAIWSFSTDEQDA